MAEDKREPLEILRKLYAELIARRPVIDKVEAYYDGAHNLAFASDKFLETFGGLFRAFADNWCGIVTNAVEERLQVNGFRVNEEPKADADAKKLWERNELDAQSAMGHLDGLIAGAFYGVAWVDEQNRAEITIESAASTIVECHPKIRTRRTAALRVWLAEDEYEHAELFRPDGLWLFRSAGKRRRGDPGGPRSAWLVEDQLDVKADLDASGMMANRLGVVPVVEFLNMPRLTISRRAGWGAHSEIASVIPLQDAVNKLMADMLVAAEFGAIPQRHLTGYTPDDELDAETGKPTGRIIPPKFRNGPGNVWWAEAAESKFGQFDPADLANFVSAIELVVQHIASISSTPPHYLRASADRLSGESIKSAESGLVAKAHRKTRGLGASWEELMRIGGKIDAIDSLANATSMETIWRDPETRTEAEHIDALGKKAQLLQVPLPQLWEEAGYTPEQIGRFPALRAQMQLEGMAANAAQAARTATEEADRLRAASLEATGGLPPGDVAA